MRDSSYWDPVRQCEGLGGCREWKHLKLYPLTEADGARTYHWFCDLHKPHEERS